MRYLDKLTDFCLWLIIALMVGAVLVLCCLTALGHDDHPDHPASSRNPKWPAGTFEGPIHATQGIL